MTYDIKLTLEHDQENQTIGKILEDFCGGDKHGGVSVVLTELVDNGVLSKTRSQYRIRLQVVLDSPAVLPAFIDRMEHNYLSQEIVIKVKRVTRK